MKSSAGILALLFLFMGTSLQAAQMSCLDIFNSTAAVGADKAATKQKIEKEETQEQRRARFKAARITEANQKLSLLRVELEKVKTKIKTDIVGMDDLVDQIAQKIYLIWEAQANMRMIEAPIVIPLMGFSGVGKTDVVKKFETYLQLSPVFVRETIQDGAYFIPHDKLFLHGRTEEVRVEDDPGEIQIGLDFFMLIDEIQKLQSFEKRQAFIEKTANPEPLQEKAVRNVEREAEDVRLAQYIREAEARWWQILGDGFAPESFENPIDRLKNIRTYIAKFETLNRAVMQVRTQVNAKLEQVEKGAATAADLVPLRETLNVAEANANSVKFFIEDLIHEIRKHCSSSLGRLSDLTLDQLVDLALQDQRIFFNTIMENYEDGNKRTKQRHFGFGIIFIAGNPEKIVASHLRTATDASGRTDPNLLRRLAEQTPRKMVEDFFYGIFGNNQAGWKTRWNFEAWNVLPPLAEKAWKLLVRSRIQDKIDIVRAQTKTLIGNKVNVKIEDSLIDSLYQTELDVGGGGRQTKKNLDRVLSDLSAELPELLRKHKESHKAWSNKRQPIELILRASPEKNAIVVEEGSASEKKFTAEITLTPTRKQVNSNGLQTPLERVQLAVYQAARIVVGTTLLGSMPRGSIETVPTAVETVDALWNKPDVTQLHYLRSKLAVAQAGYIGERLLIAESGVVNTKYAELDSMFVQTTLKEIKDELGRLQELAQKRIAPGQPVNIDHLIVGSLKNDRILRAIYKDDTADAYKALDVQVQNIITSQPELMKALVAHLSNKPYLTPEQVTELFHQFANHRPEVKLNIFRKVFNPVVRMFRRQAKPAAQVDIDLKHIFAQEPGTIENTLEAFTVPPQIPQPRKSLVTRMIERIRQGLQ